MALVLKVGKTYTCRHGLEHTEIYAVIDKVHGDKKAECAHYDLEIYCNSEARDAGKLPMESYTYQVTDEKFMNKFDRPGLNPLNKNPYKAAYKDVELIENVDANGDPIEGDYVWKDLESDE